MENELIDKFLEKLFEEEKTLIEFHEEYLKGYYEYWFFIRQIAFPWEMTKGLTEVIERYINES